MMQQLFNSGAVADIVCFPPACEFGGFPAKPVPEFEEGLIARPEIEVRPKQGEHPFRFRCPGCSKEALRCGTGKHEEEDVAIFLRRLTHVREKVGRCIIPFKYVPSSAAHISWVVQARNHAPHGFRNRLAGKCGTMGILDQSPQV